MGKQIIRMLAIAVLVCLFGATTALAQEEEQQESDQSGITVVSLFKCYGGPLGDAVDLFKEDSAPALDKLVDEGKLMSYGLLTHYWGDEWNLVIYYNAKDLATFESAFSEFLSAMDELEEPEEGEGFFDLCSEHKDNIYRQQHAYSGGDM